MTPYIAFAKLHPDATIPKRATTDSSGLDLHALVLMPAGMRLVPGSHHQLVVEPGGRLLVRTGLQVIIPRGHEGQVRPRSGLALMHGIDVVLGTIDADYRGELHVLLVNHGSESFAVLQGDRIAQIVIAPVAMLEPYEVKPQPIDTERGTGGFGSTNR